MKSNSSLALPDGNRFKKPGILFIIFTACFAFWYLDLWKPYSTSNHKNNFVWDVFGYYSYLPAKFCNNGSFEWAYSDFTNHNPIGPLKTHLPKYTYGMAVMYAPFFALGYLLADANGEPLDGFSDSFATCVRWGSIFYVLLGLFFLRRFLLFYFNDMVVTLVLALSLFGSVLFVYTFVQSEMTHGYLFCLFSIFLYLTHKWHEQQKFKYTLAISCVLGLICLIRPTEAFIVSFFLFWNVRKLPDIGLKLRFFLKNYLHLLVMLVVALLLWIPQLLFYKQHTGMYFYFPYGKEGFFWSDPQIINILFSYRKGWITYTPLILLAFIGFFFVKKEFPLSRWVLFLITALMIYVLSCWWDWGYGGSFGAREFCQHMAYLAIPLAFVIDFIFYSAKQYMLKGLVVLLASVFIFSSVCLNIGQSYQYQVMGVLHSAGMTKEMYWDIFRTYQFNKEFSKNYEEYIKEPNYKKMEKGIDRDQSGWALLDTAEKKLNKGAPPHSKYYNKRVQDLTEYIKQDSTWLEAARKNAKRDGVTLDEQITKEAKWVVDQEGVY